MAPGVERVEDARDPRLADFQDLRDPGLRARRGLFAAEGVTVVQRLVAGRRFHVRAVPCTAGALDALGPALAAGAPRAVYVAPAAVMGRVAGFAFHRGCVALAERGPDLEVAALAAPSGPRRLLALDELADPDNVGAVFRNARAFGADGVLLSAGCADPLYRKAIRTSAGATLALPFARAAEWGAALGALRGARFALVGLTPDRGSPDLEVVAPDLAARERLALLIGAEGPGLGAVSHRAADRLVRIPMAPGADSLNVATATGIALYRLAALETPRPGH